MSAVLGVGLVIGVILAHDAFTYSDKHVDRVPINPLSLHPRRGGKKNLPIIEVNLDAEEAEKLGMKDKPRLVIIGGGWGVSRSLHTKIQTRTDKIGCRFDSIVTNRRVQRYLNLSPNLFRIHPAPPFRMCRDCRTSIFGRTIEEASSKSQRALLDGISC
jgi:hypothetical protein